LPKKYENATFLELAAYLASQKPRISKQFRMRISFLFAESKGDFTSKTGHNCFISLIFPAF